MPGFAKWIKNTFTSVMDAREARVDRLTNAINDALRNDVHGFSLEEAIKAVDYYEEDLEEAKRRSTRNTSIDFGGMENLRNGRSKRSLG